MASDTSGLPYLLGDVEFSSAASADARVWKASGPQDGTLRCGIRPRRLRSGRPRQAKVCAAGGILWLRPRRNSLASRMKFVVPLTIPHHGGDTRSPAKLAPGGRPTTGTRGHTALAAKVCVVGRQRPRTVRGRAASSACYPSRPVPCVRRSTERALARYRRSTRPRDPSRQSPQRGPSSAARGRSARASRWYPVRTRTRRTSISAPERATSLTARLQDTEMTWLPTWFQLKNANSEDRTGCRHRNFLLREGTDTSVYVVKRNPLSFRGLDYN